jgi:hypothetical protein
MRIIEYNFNFDNLVILAKNDFSWRTRDMFIDIFFRNKRLFSIFIGEAMESTPRSLVMKHVDECDRSPWLTKWHGDKHV